ncbi:hypothetical protein BGW42_001373 [Actinomortierella wolfii]|nr:hypothetical protein BGW42_001373 [Actinomortierella wolfii]
MAHAQTTPRAVFAPASVFKEGQSLWVHGGADTSNSYNQFFTLDLSSSWTTDNPKITMLPPTANPNSHHTASLTRDGENMIVFSRSSSITRCSLATASWSTDMATSQFNDRYQLDAVTDPNTGNIYVPGGYGASQSMMIYSPGAKVATQDSVNYLLQYIGYAAMWNAQRKSVMTFGGNILDTSTSIHEYVPGVGWSVVPFRGDAPISRSNACLVPAYNGTKAVLFGGYNNSTYYSDIYILDQGTMTWTKGPVGSFGGRAMSACAVTGDHFVSWGGYDGTDAIKNNITVVFNLQTMQWQNKFVANTDFSGGSNKGAIIGGVVGGVAAIALIVGGILIYRRKKAQLAPVPATAADIGTSGNAGTGCGGGYDAVKMYDYNQLSLQQPQHVSTYFDPMHSQPAPGAAYVPLSVYEPSPTPESFHPQQSQQHLSVSQAPTIFQPVTTGEDLGYIPPQQYHQVVGTGYDAPQIFSPQTVSTGSPASTAAYPASSTVNPSHVHHPSGVEIDYKVPTETGNDSQTAILPKGPSPPQGPQFVPPPGTNIS